MIADTTFLSDLIREQRNGVRGDASLFFHRHRTQKIRTTIISAGEISLLFRRTDQAWDWLTNWTIYRLHAGIVNAATEIDRHLIKTGQRLGENDNWIAGYAAYYREPLVSRDVRFDDAPGVRRISY